jgi:hypothetical protein
MALPGPEQAISAYRAKLGIEWRRLVSSLLDMCKGKLTGDLSDRFYGLFLNRGNYGTPKTIEDVRRRLRAAWWVEREDLKQHLIYAILRDKIYYKGDDVFMVLAREMRDHLVIDHRVFARQTHWQDKYLIDYLNNQEKLHDIPARVVFQLQDNVLANLTLFERYFAYLKNNLGLSRQELEDILLTHPRQLNRLGNQTQQKLEDLLCQSMTPKTKTS